MANFPACGPISSGRIVTAICLKDVSKSYPSTTSAGLRFIQMLRGSVSDDNQQVALHPMSLRIDHGEVVGLIGENGAGKSTLLKLMAGTLLPSSGSLKVNGRVCALLELGAGFHPDMSGRDNVYLAGAVAGLSTSQVDALMPDIVAFSELHRAIDKPVKTYSSGMSMRLAFSVSTAVDPDILILDETLSVGDGRFAKKSFDRIMSFKDAGKTILFCSHSMYQVQAICSRAIWLDGGIMKMDGNPEQVIMAYNAHMKRRDGLSASVNSALTGTDGEDVSQEWPGSKLRQVGVLVDGVPGRKHAVRSGKSNLEVRVDFYSDPKQPIPTVAVVIIDENGHPISSVTSLIDGMEPCLSALGLASISLVFPRLPLMKGHYWVHVFLLCDRGVHIYDKARMIAELVVTQDHPAIGIVSLPRKWSMGVRKRGTEPLEC